VRIPGDAIPFIRAGIPCLGPAEIPSPLPSAHLDADIDANRVLLSPYLSNWRENAEEPLSYELAGPRNKLFFDPSTVRAAIVTCGGLCPGINDVIRSLVITLHDLYGAREVYGIRYGFRGLVEGHDLSPMHLDPLAIEPISNEGGSFLGSSRDRQNPRETVDFLQKRGIDILFVIGGDGTQKSALEIAKEAESRGYPLSVVGLPKTIDNDIGLVEKTFGFDTAVSIATEVLRGAHVEARGGPNGLFIVKLMGRQSGFLATHAAIASGDVNFVLVPEIPFDLEGEAGLFSLVRKRIELRGHALLAVAEGVAEKIENIGGDNRVGWDVGDYLALRFTEYFRSQPAPARVRYIDPSYIVRSVPANSVDSIFCQNLAHHAVHAAMSGRTRMLVATCNRVYCHIPLDAVVLEKRFVDPEGLLWRSALETTGQPACMVNP